MLSTARERDFSRKRIDEPGTGWGFVSWVVLVSGGVRV